ncbi:MAG: FKBP-type peptidyl-prolyl cis-trans isomerase [Pirellulales bacterium]|nr:FKBP-type peptidyl-prolyl cis-trans isomerase [Pirellulales bacterium]
MGQQMNQSGFRLGDFDLESLKAGFVDGLAKKDAVLTPEQLREAEGEIQALLSRRHEERLAEKKAEGDAWLKENAKKEGIKTLAQGLQYKVLKSGNGKSPARTDTVRVHYTGKLTNGQVFDSSVQRGQPAEFGVGQVIAGWTMALQKMKVGDKWMLYIPSELAYGERGSRGAIGPNEVLIFEVELLDIL